MSAAGFISWSLFFPGDLTHFLYGQKEARRCEVRRKATREEKVYSQKEVQTDEEEKGLAEESEIDKEKGGS